MILRIDQGSQEPLYLQIRNQLVGAIARGELLPGDRLPGVRALASDLGINLHTVNKAYAVLRDEGYLLMRGRSGAFVADATQAASAERRADAEKHAAEALRGLALEWRARGGDAAGFVDLAAASAAAVFDDPGVAGASRDVAVRLAVGADLAPGAAAVASGAGAGALADSAASALSALAAGIPSGLAPTDLAAPAAARP